MASHGSAESTHRLNAGATADLVSQEIEATGQSLLNPLAFQGYLRARNDGSTPEAPGVVFEGDSIRIVEWRQTGVQAKRPYSPANLYSHYQHETTGRQWTFTEFELSVEGWESADRLYYLARTLLDSRTQGTGSLRVMPSDLIAASATGGGGIFEDPRDPFVIVPPGLLALEQPAENVMIAGRLGLLTDAGMRLRVSGTQGATVLESGCDRTGVPDAMSTSRCTFFIAEINHGQLRATSETLTSLIVTPKIVGNLDGRFTGVAGQGTISVNGESQSVSAERLTLEGAVALDLRPKPGPSGKAPDAQVQSSLTARSPILAGSGAATTTPLGDSLLPGGIILGALGAVGVAAAYPGFLRRGHAKPAIRASAAPATAVAPAATPPTGSPTTDVLAAQYRTDPGNVQLALELGLSLFRDGRHAESLPLLTMASQAFPKVEAIRYSLALALLKVNRADEAVKHLEFSFRLNPLNVARFVSEGPGHEHGAQAPVRLLLQRWSRRYHEANSRGYA